MKLLKIFLKQNLTEKQIFLWSKMIGKICHPRKLKGRTEKIYIQGNGQKYYPECSRLLTHFAAQLLIVIYLIELSPFRCIIAACSLRGEIFLYLNTTLVVKHKSNAITHARISSKSFKSCKITGSQWSQFEAYFTRFLKLKPK